LAIAFESIGNHFLPQSLSLLFLEPFSPISAFIEVLRLKCQMWNLTPNIYFRGNTVDLLKWFSIKKYCGSPGGGFSKEPPGH